MSENIKITINGQEVEAEKGSVLIDVCHDNAEHIPSFCYYKDLEPQASCRMCLVRIDKMPKLQTSCTIKVTDGMVVTTRSPEIEKAQRSMGEFLLANHPLDCPVCDRGGECELQEVIFDWGDVEERFTEPKNKAPEKYLSPIVANDPQRCILCKRCTRVCSEWMGEDAIEAGNRGSSTVIGTYGGWLNCSQCGNCIEVCPTGTLLDGVYRHETRPWELDQTISTDVYGSDGMQLSIGSRSGKVHRIVARDRYVNGLNGEFLDVKARFGHEFIGHKDRIKTPMIRYSKGGKLVPATWDQAIERIVAGFTEPARSIGVIATPRLTNESLFALGKLASDVLKGPIGIDDRGDMSAFFDNLSVPLCTHDEIRHAKTILLIGGEPEEEQTYTAKQIRQAVRNGGAKLMIVNETRINLAHQAATQFIHAARGSLDAFALAAVDPSYDSLVAEKLGINAGEIDTLRRTLFETKGDLVIMCGADVSPEAQVIIAGSAASLSGEGRRVLLHPLPLYNNSVGAIDILPEAMTASDVAARSKALLVAGSLQDPGQLEGKEFIVVQELFETETTEFADIILPAASFAEVDGTFTNNAGNVQRVRKAIEPLHQSRPDWLIAAKIAQAMGADPGFELSASGVFRALADSVPTYGGLRYPALKDESRPVQAKYVVQPGREISRAREALIERIKNTEIGGKNFETPRIGHKLHRITTLTGKTAQFHLLANGNPKPENLLLSPLEQFEMDGTPRADGLVDAAAVGISDRTNPGGR
ncbi:MAG TPA: molybdopterin-dependent oxidoreductase [Pyrinomonadaceae bacterium]|nr:molybdopterin-dependent oxidoreductase [Pyrinomonadaceae bacterium]